MTLWNYTLPDGMIAWMPVWMSPTRIRRFGCRQLHGLQESGVPKALHSWTAGGAEYEIYQTVTAMEGQVL